MIHPASMNECFNQWAFSTESVWNHVLCKDNQHHWRVELCVVIHAKFSELSKCPILLSSKLGLFVNFILYNFMHIYTWWLCEFYAFPAIFQGCIKLTQWMVRNWLNFRFNVNKSIKYNYCCFSFEKYFWICKLV